MKMPRRSAITKLLSFAKEERRRELQEIIGAHDKSGFPFHTYIIVGWTEDRTLWCKIGRAKNLKTRLASFGYPDYFDQLGITTLHLVAVVSWLTEDDYKAAEVYVHHCLAPFRYKFAGWGKKSEWFTNEHTTFTTDEFIDEITEVWDRLKRIGALCGFNEDGVVFTNNLDPKWLPLKVTKIAQNP